MTTRTPRALPPRVPALVHVDPSTSGYLGVASIVGDVVRVARVRALPNAVGRTWVERVLPLIELAQADARAQGEQLVVACERPPPTMQKKSGRQGSQGVIGLALGRVLGAAELWCTQAGVMYVETTVSTWHDYRDELCRVHGIGLPEEARSRNPYAPRCKLDRQLDRPRTGTTVARWSCGTERTVRVVSLDTMSTDCPVHDVPLTDSQKQAQVTDQHKATSYAVAAHLWPSQVAGVVAAARDGARGDDAQERTPWRLAGVSDACEAMLQALTVRDKGLGATQARG